MADLASGSSWAHLSRWHRKEIGGAPSHCVDPLPGVWRREDSDPGRRGKRPPHPRAPESGAWRGGKAPRRGLTGVRRNGSSPAPPRSVGALGWAQREPQPFPGGGPGGPPAPAPTGARRLQECDRPDSPAPPSYLPPPHKAVHSPPRRPPTAARPPDSPVRRAPAVQPPNRVQRGEGASPRRGRCSPPTLQAPGTRAQSGRAVAGRRAAPRSRPSMSLSSQG